MLTAKEVSEMAELEKFTYTLATARIAVLETRLIELKKMQRHLTSYGKWMVKNLPRYIELRKKHETV